MESATVGIVLNTVLSFALIYVMGFAGAVVGTATSMIVSSAYFVWMFHRQTEYPYGRLLRESYLKPILVSALVLGAMLLLRHTALHDKNLSWLGLVAMGLIFGSLYCVGIVLVRFFDAYDWSKIESLVPGLRRITGGGQTA